MEAGGPDNDKWIHIPIGISYLLKERKHNWFYMTEPEAHMKGRQVYWPRGKVLGGSSSINGMVYIRGQANDFDGWALQGATGWDWKTMLPYFRKSQDQVRGEDAFHGTGGPIAVADRSNRNPLWDAFIAAATANGIPFNPDFNGERQEGVGYYQATIRKGRRSSAAVGYLHPAMRRPNVRVLTRAMAHQLVYEGTRVVGVQFEKDGQLHEVRARNEVLLCGGSINTPQLLMLSGIGPREQLEKLGIPAKVHAEGVGKNLQDHLQIRMTYRVNQPVTFNDQFHSRWGKLKMVMEYALFHQGTMAYPTAQTGIFTRSSPHLGTPDIQYHFNNFTRDPETGLPHKFAAMTYSACHLRPQSRGEILLRSTNPMDHPQIFANYLSAPEDCRVAIEEVRLTRRLAATRPMADFVESELEPGLDVRSDDRCLDFARANGSSIYHPIGTCRMGADPESVVDPQLHVRGVTGLRVVDASIMPTLVSGNTNAATIAMAERAADLISATHLS